MKSSLAGEFRLTTSPDEYCYQHLTEMTGAELMTVPDDYILLKNTCHV